LSRVHHAWHLVAFQYIKKLSTSGFDGPYPLLSEDHASMSIQNYNLLRAIPVLFFTVHGMRELGLETVKRIMKNY
jgi:hypothetical protein